MALMPPSHKIEIEIAASEKGGVEGAEGVDDDVDGGSRELALVDEVE